MHKINTEKWSLHTDLISEQKKSSQIEKIIFKNEYVKIRETYSRKKKYTTIYFKDITDKDNFYEVQKIFVNELKNYLKLVPQDKILVIGLGNQKSTADSLGPKTIENILVTRYLFLLGEVEEGYSNVATFIPNVMGNTGIETSQLIKRIIEEVTATKVIVIDSLKTNNIKRLNKTIQITNEGISPGSGIGNTRTEISKKTMNKEIIAIGVPTVVDIASINHKYDQEKLIVTPTNIDFLIEKLALLIGNGINISLHKNFIRQNNR